MDNGFENISPRKIYNDPKVRKRTFNIINHLGSGTKATVRYQLHTH